MPENDYTRQKNNEDFDRIIDKADRLKRIDNKRQEEEVEKPKRETFRKPYSFLLFRSLKISYVGFWWLVLGTSIPIPILWIGYGNKTVRYICYALMAVTALRIIIHYIIMYFRYLEYRKIFQELPFKIYGWEELVSSANFVKYRFWRHGEIQFHFSNNNVPDKVIKSLIYLFISEANSNFYFTYDMPTPQEWKAIAENHLKGDINCRVAGAFYLFLTKELIPFHRKYNCVDKIEILFEKGYFRADPIETTSSEGTAS
jgi:hypothetical protein